MTVLVLLGLLPLLLLAHWRCLRLTNRTRYRMMRPVEEWEPEDTDRWLSLIEPFPLPEPRRQRR